jgi:hypothetical protein
MICESRGRRAHTVLPTFWSNQFGVNIKSVGVPSFAEEVMLTQGRIDEHHFVVAYGHRGRIVAAVSFNYAMRLPVYEVLIEASAPFPPKLRAPDEPHARLVIPAAFPQPGQTTHTSVVSATGNELPKSHAMRPMPTTTAPPVDGVRSTTA